VQHTAAGEGAELVAPDAVLTVKIDAGHTDGHYELFEVDAPRGRQRHCTRPAGARPTTSYTAG
jgi:hypothetical protein